MPLKFIDLASPDYAAVIESIIKNAIHKGDTTVSVLHRSGVPVGLMVVRPSDGYAAVQLRAYAPPLALDEVVGGSCAGALCRVEAAGAEASVELPTGSFMTVKVVPELDEASNTIMPLIEATFYTREPGAVAREFPRILATALAEGRRLVPVSIMISEAEEEASAEKA